MAPHPPCHPPTPKTGHVERRAQGSNLHPPYLLPFGTMLRLAPTASEARSDGPQRVQPEKPRPLWFAPAPVAGGPAGQIEH